MNSLHIAGDWLKNMKTTLWMLYEKGSTRTQVKQKHRGQTSLIQSNRARRRSLHEMG